MLAALATSFCEPAEGEEDAGRPAGRTDGAAAVEQPGLLHMRIVEVPECALQFFERTENALEVGRLITGGRGVDEIPKLFRIDADLVNLLGRTELVNCLGPSGNPFAQLPRAPRDRCDQRIRCVGGLRCGRDRRIEKDPPVRQQSLIPGAVQGADEAFVFLLLRTGQELAERIHVVRIEFLALFSEGEGQHIRVAGGSGETADPRELTGEVFDDLRRKHVADLPEQRARAPDRDAVVVEEFAVHVAADAGFVGHEDLEQGQVDLPGADVSAHPRVQRRFWRRQITRFQGAEMAKNGADGAFGTRLNAGPAGDYRHQLLVFVFVSAQRRQREHRGHGRHWLSAVASRA